MKTIILLAILIALCWLSASQVNQTEKALVLYENQELLSDHVLLFQDLRGIGIVTCLEMGLSLQFEVLGGSSATISPEYQHLIIFAPTFRCKCSVIVELKKTSLSMKDILKFPHDGRNLVLFTSEKANYFARKIGLEFGSDFAEHLGKVEDHVLNESNPNVVKTSQVSPFVFTTPSSPQKGILYEGIWQILTKQHESIIPLLSSEPSSTVSSERETERVKTKVLVSGFQDQNPLSRAAISGSSELCSDRFFQDSIDSTSKIGISANRQFCRQMFEWVTQRRGVIKGSFRAYQKGSQGTKIYSKHLLSLDVDISVLNNGKWEPMILPEGKLPQAELQKKEMFVRASLYETNTPGRYSFTFKKPLQIDGTYETELRFNLEGYSELKIAKEVVLSPMPKYMRNRFTNYHLPYYAAVLVTIGLFLAFLFPLLYSKTAHEKRD